MTELPTVEICSPKDASQKWIINECDYDPAVHTLWGESVETTDDPPVVYETHQRLEPAHPDFVIDDSDEIVAVNIINPERRTSRKEIPISEYDPDQHDLWSTHPRFQ